jgi:hypothetical protein
VIFDVFLTDVNGLVGEYRYLHSGNTSGIHKHRCHNDTVIQEGKEVTCNYLDYNTLGALRTTNSVAGPITFTMLCDI